MMIVGYNMKKITIAEGYKRLEDINLVHVFASLRMDRLEEDATLLKERKHIKDAIYKAEKNFGIDDLKHEIEMLKVEEDYITPKNVVFYYKDLLSKEVTDSNFDMYTEVKNKICDLELKVNEISEHIVIRI